MNSTAIRPRASKTEDLKVLPVSVGMRSGTVAAVTSGRDPLARSLVRRLFEGAAHALRVEIFPVDGGAGLLAPRFIQRAPIYGVPIEG